MDGPLIATIVSSTLVVGGGIIGGFWRVLNKIGDQNEAIGNQNKAIGEVKGELTGINMWMEGNNQRVGALEESINQLHIRVNNVISISPKRTRKKPVK